MAFEGRLSPAWPQNPRGAAKARRVRARDGGGGAPRYLGKGSFREKVTFFFELFSHKLQDQPIGSSPESVVKLIDGPGRRPYSCSCPRRPRGRDEDSIQFVSWKRRSDPAKIIHMWPPIPHRCPAGGVRSGSPYRSAFLAPLCAGGYGRHLLGHTRDANSPLPHWLDKASTYCRKRMKCRIGSIHLHRTAHSYPCVSFRLPFSS